MAQTISEELYEYLTRCCADTIGSQPPVLKIDDTFLLLIDELDHKLLIND